MNKILIFILILILLDVLSILRQRADQAVTLTNKTSKPIYISSSFPDANPIGNTIQAGQSISLPTGMTKNIDILEKEMPAGIR